MTDGSLSKRHFTRNLFFVLGLILGLMHFVQGISDFVVTVVCEENTGLICYGLRGLPELIEGFEYGLIIIWIGLFVLLIPASIIVFKSKVIKAKQSGDSGLDLIENLTRDILVLLLCLLIPVVTTIGLGVNIYTAVCNKNSGGLCLIGDNIGFLLPYLIYSIIGLIALIMLGVIGIYIHGIYKKMFTNL